MPFRQESYVDVYLLIYLTDMGLLEGCDFSGEAIIIGREFAIAAIMLL